MLGVVVRWEIDPDGTEALRNTFGFLTNDPAPEAVVYDRLLGKLMSDLKPHTGLRYPRLKGPRFFVSSALPRYIQLQHNYHEEQGAHYALADVVKFEAVVGGADRVYCAAVRVSYNTLVMGEASRSGIVGFPLYPHGINDPLFDLARQRAIARIKAEMAPPQAWPIVKLLKAFTLPDTPDKTIEDYLEGISL